MRDEAEYGFWHLLVRDVCYAQIPRAARAARHRAAAVWLEDQAGERAEDLADVLASHYLTALELVGAAGQAEQAKELEANAIHYLALAGERALPLDVERAEASLARALALAPAGHPERASLLERWAQAAQQQGRPQESRAALEEALDLYRRQDASIAAGRALTALVLVLEILGDPRHEEALEEALALLEAEPPGPELVAAYTQLARSRFVRSAYREAIAAAERALTLAAELGLPEPARALGYGGAARAHLGERQGLEDMRQALALALEQGQGHVAAVLHNNLALTIWPYEGPRAALDACREGIDFCERRGITELALSIAAMSPTFLAESGGTEQALAETVPLAERLEAAGDIASTEPRSVQLLLLTERGAHEHAAAADELVAVARESGAPPFYAMTFTAATRLLLAQGHRQQANALLVELVQVPEIEADPYYATALPTLARTALALRQPELAERLVDGVEPRTPLAEHALHAARAQLAEAVEKHAEAAAQYAEAAERWREFGNVPERAYALLGQGRSLAALGRPGAREPLREARELFASMGYRPALAETHTLLDRATAAAS